MPRLEDDDHFRHQAWNDDAHGDADEMGPQGAALILELQRLRQAIDAERADHAETRAPQRGRADHGPRRRPGPAKAPPRKKPRRKSRVKQAVNLCLKPFLPKPAAANSPPEKVAEHPRVPPRRASSPSIAPEAPIPMDLPKRNPETTDAADKAASAPAHPLQPMLPRVEKAAGHLVGRCRTRLAVGVDFMLGRNDPLSTEDGFDENLMLRARRGFERELRIGLRVLLAAVLLGGSWFVFMPLAGAVVVPGNLVVQSNVKTIQHPTGGVVAEIDVHNGSRVRAGDLLIRLDATQAQASLQMVSKQLDEVRAKMARLVAERDGLAALKIPAALTARPDDETVKSLLASEESLFKARASARASQKDLLKNRVAQLNEEISGYQSQIASKAKQLELIQGELAGVQDLYDKHLVPLTRLTTLQREAARIDGERGQLVSAIAETHSKIDEAQLQIVRLDQDFRTEVVKDLSDAQGKEAELVERGVAARDLLDRIEIRAPTSGVVNQLSAHTIGGVIRAGDTIMEIVPDKEDLQIEARLQPQDIDHVRTGQKAFVRFSAFNQRTTPQLTGTVSYVSADTSHDRQTNAPYFTVRVKLPDEERRRLAGQQLVPGMPAEVFMQTGSRTMMSYLFKPIADQMRRAFVEQ